MILVFHLAAVVVAPLALVDPASELAVAANRLLSPWSRTMYLDHGYRFFAPEPGPSHIVEYEIRRADGSTLSGRFPDSARHWPRLLYHRWFMLSETLYQYVSLTLTDEQLQEWETEVTGQIGQRIADGDPQDAERIELEYLRERGNHDRTRQLLDMLADHVGQELMRRHDGVSISMKMVTRLIPRPGDIRRGGSLDDPRYVPEDLHVDLGSGVNRNPEIEDITPGESGPADPGDSDNHP